MELKTITMTELLDNVYELRTPIIENLLYAGLYIFAGPPKVGKSFMVAQIGYHISMGEPLWDMGVSEGTVLYLALEDVEGRIQQRVAKMYPKYKNNDKLHFATESDMLNKGLINQLNEFVKKYSDIKLIVIDTLQKIKDNDSGSSNYSNDYDVIGKLKKFADDHNVCVLVVHHTRKQESNDSFDMISGTQGLLGAADGALVISKERRTSNKAWLEITSRDQQDMKLELEMERSTCLWKLVRIENELWKEPEDETLAVLNYFVEEQNGRWTGRASELLDEISVQIENIYEEYTPNTFVRKLNVSATRLRTEYGIIYKNKRTNRGSKITLIKLENE